MIEASRRKGMYLIATSFLLNIAIEILYIKALNYTTIGLRLICILF